MIRVAGALLLAAALLGPSPAYADELQDFELARNAYESQNYPLAVERFEALVGGPVPRLQTRLYVLDSRKYLGAAYLFVGRRADAEAQFEALLRDDPTYQLDPIAFPTEVLDVFTTVRSRIRQQLQAEIEARRRAEEETRQRETARLLRQQQQMRRLLDLAGSETVERYNSRLIACVPFGVGQFQNDHFGLGLALAIGEGILVTTMIVSYFIWAAIPVDAEDRGGAAVAEEAARLTNQISALALVVTMAVGIGDAQLRFRPFIRETRRRALPPDLEAGVQVSLGPGGAAFSLTF